MMISSCVADRLFCLLALADELRAELNGTNLGIQLEDLAQEVKASLGEGP